MAMIDLDHSNGKKPKETTKKTKILQIDIRKLRTKNEMKKRFGGFFFCINFCLWWSQITVAKIKFVHHQS